MIYTPFNSLWHGYLRTKCPTGRRQDTATVTIDVELQDIPGDRTTTERINAGDIITSEHMANDFADFFAFDAVAGKISIEGTATGRYHDRPAYCRL